ncbi:MAG: hypothetical protein ACOYMB_00345 [Patescibacteria group bacterium]
MARSTDLGKTTPGAKKVEEILDNKEVGEKSTKEKLIEEKKNLPSVADLFKIVLSFAISLGVFMLFRDVLLKEIGMYLLRSLAALFVSFLALGAISLAISKPTTIGVPVVVWLFFWFFLGIFIHQEPKKDEPAPTPIENVSVRNPEIQTLDVGSHSFFLKSGEELGPLKAIDDLKFTWSIRSSLDKNYWTISLNNGTPLDGLTMKVLPLLDGSTSFVVKATKDQTVTIDIVPE